MFSLLETQMISTEEQKTDRVLPLAENLSSEKRKKDDVALGKTLKLSSIR